MRKNSFFIILLVATITVDVFSQRWQPAAQIDGAVLNINIITLPDGTTLIPLMRMKPNQEDSNTLYSVQSLLTDRMPWPRQFEGLPPVTGVYQSNSVAYPEISVKQPLGTTHFYYDAFSDFERLIDTPTVNGSWPVRSAMVVHEGDLDGDGFRDQIARHREEQYARVVFGDRVVPYVDHSVVPANYQRANEWRARILAVGPLSGKMCMVQLAFKADDYNSGFYQLLELNSEDLRARRDTIRTTLLNEVANPSKKLFSSVVLKADTVWHFFHGGLGADNLCLKVTLNNSNISRTSSVIPMSDYLFWYGQGKIAYESNYPVAMSADRLIASEAPLGPGLGQRVLRLYRCTDTDSAVLTTFADAQLPIHADSNRAQAIGTCVLIPDHDGDGIEDVVVEHYWTDPGTTTPRNAVSIFLTSDIEPVSVDDQVLHIEALDASTVITARRLDNAWIVPLAGRCAQRDLSPVYNVQGQKIATVRTEVIGDDVILHDNGSITERPAWCVVGTCVIRLY